jgi:polyisoprenoid-binding protein YceI
MNVRCPVFCLLSATLAFAECAIADAAQWLSRPESSELSFSAWYEGTELPGQFTVFTARVTSDEAGSVPRGLAVEVEVSSADMQDREVNEELLEPEWFDVSSFPLARFSSEEIHSTDSGYVAIGHLRIKGIELRLELPLQWRREGEFAVLSGSTVLSRNDWQIGTGDWADDARLSDRVELRYEVMLAPQP